MEINATLEKLKKMRLELYNCTDVDKKNKNYKEYIQSLRKLAYRGNPEAQYDLAQHYEDMGVMGYPNPYHSISKKFYWYLKAAEKNHPEALNNLANMYVKGEFCKQDIQKALELFEKAANSGISYIVENYKLLLKQIKMGKYNSVSN
jgi:TPR repeat protein